MEIKSRVWYIALLFVFPLPTMSRGHAPAKIEGVVVDITGARIQNAMLIFANETREYSTKTGGDGTYSIELKSGKYTMEVTSNGFCTLRRAAFVLQRRSTVQFKLQMWVCPTDTQFIQYTEFEEVPRTNLKPHVLYAEKNQGNLLRFKGPNTFDDGTGHSRQYPAVFTFNLLTVRAEEIVYDPTKHLLSAFGDVHWQNENKSGTSANLQVKLDGLKPRVNEPTQLQATPN
jgi:hypothetical protein